MHTDTHTHTHTPPTSARIGGIFLFQVFIEISVQILTDWTITADHWPNRTGTSEATQRIQTLQNCFRKVTKQINNI